MKCLTTGCSGIMRFVSMIENGNKLLYCCTKCGHIYLLEKKYKTIKKKPEHYFSIFKTKDFVL